MVFCLTYLQSVDLPKSLIQVYSILHYMSNTGLCSPLRQSGGRTSRFIQKSTVLSACYIWLRLCLNLFLYNGDLQSNKLSGLSAITPFVNVYVAPPTPGHPAKHHDTAESTASYLALVCVPTCVILCESLMKTQLPRQISLATTAYDGM